MTPTTDHPTTPLRPATMRRWVLQAGATTLSGLVQQQVPLPEPGPGEVRVKVHAVSLNSRDQLILHGAYDQTPTEDLIPLSDGAGEIDALGADVTTWAVGDRVTSLYYRGWPDGPPQPDLGFGLGSKGNPGMLAEYVVLPADQLGAAPRSLSLLEAATLPCAGLTAWTALHGDRPYARRLLPTDKVLVLGTGGVALFALALARAVGADVVATSSQEDKLTRLRAAGATDVLNYRTLPAWGEEVFARTGGVQWVVNSIGSGTLDHSLAAVAYGGEVALLGYFDHAEQAPNFFTLMGKGATVRGVSVGSAAAYQDFVAFIDAHGIKPPISQVFAFDAVRDAYQAATAPELFGKVVIAVLPPA